MQEFNTMKIKLSFLFLFFIGLKVLSQETPRIIPPTPEAAALTKYVDIPVSTFTGTPNISIPLYTINSRDITVPLSVSYHAGGFRVTEEASYVGLGWTLNAGGVITRTIRGKDDFAASGYLNSPKIIDILCGGGTSGPLPDPPPSGYNGFCTGTESIGAFGDWRSCVVSVDGVSQDYSNEFSGTFDWEPDLFSFNFMGYSGKFVFDQDGNVHLLDQQKMKIEKIAQGWEVTLDNGYKYEFLIDEKISDGLGTASGSSWYLTKIISPLKETVDFQYQTGGTVRSQPSLSEYDIVAPGSSGGGAIKNFGSTTYIAKYLDTISFKNGYVRFQRSGTEREDLKGALKLEKMQIFNNQNELLKEFEFSTNYFVSDFESIGSGNYSLSSNDLHNYAGKRLKLEKIIERAGTEEKEYNFDYNPTKLPYKTSYSQDYWGYFNGRSNNTLIPEIKDVINNNGVFAFYHRSGANRKSDKDAQLACVLSSIQYPTGGTSSYILEAHEYSNAQVVNDYGFSDSSYMAMHQYGFGDPSSNTGDVTFQIPNNLSAYTVEVIVNAQCSTCFGFDQDAYVEVVRGGTRRYYFEEAVENPAGGASYYLKESLSRISGNVTLRVVLPDEGDTRMASVTLRYKNQVWKSKSFAGGLRAKKITFFDGIDHNKDIIKEYNYNLDETVEDGTPKPSGRLKNPIDFYYIFGLGGPNNDEVRTTSSSSYTLPFNKSTHLGYDRVKESFGTNSVSGYTFYHHHNRENTLFPNKLRPQGIPASYSTLFDGKVKSETSYTQAGNKVKEVLYNYIEGDRSIIKGVFVGDVVEPGAGNCHAPMHYYPIYSTWYYLHTTKERVYSQEDPTKFIETLTENTYDLYSKGHYQLSKSTTYNSKDQNGEPEVIETYFKYPLDYATPGTAVNKLNEKHIVSTPIEQTTWVNGILVSGNATKYSYNATNDLVLPNIVHLIETTGGVTNLLESTNGETFDGLYKPREQFTYDHLGNIIEYAKTADFKTAYIWGYNETLPVAQIINASYAAAIAELAPGDLALLQGQTLTDQQVRDKIHNIRLGLNEAHVSAYTYEPLKGMTSATDANQYTYFYDYDNFSRLHLIKDDNEDILNRFTYGYGALPGQNFIKTETIWLPGKKLISELTGLSVGEKVINFQFFDGLGRIVQRLDWRSAPDEKDIVQPFAYDPFGRQKFEYLPYWINANTGSFRTNALADQATFFNNSSNKVATDSRPYTEHDFEPSPLNRLKTSLGPGTYWNNQNRKTGFALKTNAAGSIRRWEVINNQPVSYLFYGAEELLVNETIDEENHIMKEYIDKLGRTVLKEVQGPGSDWFKTFYVYDDFGNLRYAIPPQASDNLQLSNAVVGANTEFLDSDTSFTAYQNKSYLFGPGVTVTLSPNFHYTASAGNGFSIKSGATPAQVQEAYLFQYEYDERQRMIRKKIPGADWVYMVYDSWDRLVLTQDGRQRNLVGSNKEWTFTKYDVLNRPVLTGIYSTGQSHVTLRNSAMAASARYENKNTTEIGYSWNQTFPASGIAEADLLTTIYYDGNSFTGNTGWGSSYNFQGKTGFNDTPESIVKGQTTGGMVRMLNSNADWLKDVIHYDKKYRIVQSVTENHLGGKDRTTNAYDFADRITKSLREHQSGTDQVEVLKEFAYDHAGRMGTIHQTIDGGPRTLMVANEYNKLGELVEKNLHSNNGSTFLQSVDYRYNIRGWLSHINNSTLTNDGTYNDDTNDLFGMELIYNQAMININGTNTEKQYNGNISAIKWQTDIQSGTPKERVYGYTYDPLNRLTTARYAAKSGATWTGEAGFHDVENLQYDKNGNILSLKRYANIGGVRDVIDSLSYAYGNTNQLQSVQDNGGTDDGFLDGVDLATEYAYDDNGNLRYDLNKDINAIRYNYLNLPSEVEFQSGQKIVFTYDAAGLKLKKEVMNSDGSTLAEVDYVNGFQYEDGALSFLMTDEGRALKNGNDFEYEYFLTDHLGNTRLTFGWLKDKDVFKATMETENNTEESVNFIKLDTRATSVANNHTASYEVEGTANEAARLNGFDNTAVGPGIVLENVVAGDKVSAEVFARYTQSTSTNATVSATMFSLVSSAFGIVNGGETAALYSYFDNNWATTLGTIASSGSTEPKAYLNYIIFRDGLSGVPQFGFIPVTTAASTDFEKLSFEIDIPYSGDMYIYVANESNEQDLFVWFDDLKVVHQKNSWGMEVTGADDYYPFGLQIAQNAYQRESPFLQNYKYNGKELQPELGLNWIDYGFRYYDPAIGRWLAVDPLADELFGITPYNYTVNNPALFIDPNGLMFAPHLFNTDPINNKFEFDDSRGKAPVDRRSGFDKFDFNPRPRESGFGQISNFNPDIAGAACPTCPGGDEVYAPGAIVDQGIIGKWEYLGDGDWKDLKTGTVTNYSDYTSPENLGSISQFEPNFFGDLKEGINKLPLGLDFAGDVLFNTADNLFISLLQFGGDRRNLEGFGVNRSQITDAGINSLITIAPVGKITAPAIKGINAVQFGSLFKGTFITKLKPQFRGILNRQLNSQLIKKQVKLTQSTAVAGAKILGNANSIEQ